MRLFYVNYLTSTNYVSIIHITKSVIKEGGDIVTVNQNIERVRRAKGVTKTHLAKVLGMSLQGYRYLENGSVRLDVERMKVIGDALGVDSSIFLDDKLTDSVICG
ncbi:DNA-binding helix-turn-helix protein [Selenomonas sp. oral taxon 149 str. 67H29BP]|nr:DNA-binding helix-turn-helix protein [Selenomonas sp. oral taxon 149 str. 67H29BP]